LTIYRTPFKYRIPIAWPVVLPDYTNIRETWTYLYSTSVARKHSPRVRVYNYGGHKSFSLADATYTLPKLIHSSFSFEPTFSFWEKVLICTSGVQTL